MLFFSAYISSIFFFLSCGSSKTVVRQPFSRPCLECQTSLIPLRRTPEPGFRKFCWKHFPHVASAVKSHNGTELILHHVKSLCGGSRLRLSELTLVILRVPLEFPGLAWSEASSSNMSLPHFVNFVPFFFLFLVALWCYASPSPPLSRFYILKRSESWQQHNRQATRHVEGRFPRFRSRVQRTHAHWRIHVSVHIVLTSWQEAYTSGFPRQQVCKISNIDLHSVCLRAEIVRMLKTYMQATNERTWDWSLFKWLLSNSVWEHGSSDLEEAQTPVRLYPVVMKNANISESLGITLV